MSNCLSASSHFMILHDTQKRRTLKHFMLPLDKNETFLLILKNPVVFIVLFLVAACYSTAFAQQPRLPGTLQNLSKPGTPQQANALPDTSRIRKDTAKAPKGEIQTTIKYNAKDSIVYDLKTKLAFLYGSASTTYGSTQLDAEQIRINQQTQTLSAKGIPDTSGTLIGSPEFKQGNEKFEAESIDFNLKSGRGLIKKVVTTQGEAFITGETVKKDNEGNLYLRNARYTTCNLANPHWFFQASKIKKVGDKQIVTGPFNFHLVDIPTPLGFWMGIFPINTKSKQSGIIIPAYGEEPNGRGFYLRSGGYYWAVNDYVGLTFLGEIYSKGGFGLSSNGQYTKKYAYNGSFNLRFNQRLDGEEGAKLPANDFWISWSHTPLSKGTGRFSASVNAGTNSYNSRNSFQLINRVSTSFSSNISYSKTFAGTPFSMSVAARYNMNVQTKVADMTLPDFSLQMNRLYPLNFGNIKSSGSKFWQTLNVGWTVRASNQLSNVTIQGSGTNTNYPFSIDYGNFIKYSDGGRRSDTLNVLKDFPLILQRGQYGAIHDIPVSMTMRVLKYFNLSPSFSYNEIWYPKRLDYVFNDKTGQVRIDTLNKFSRVYRYSLSTGITTRIFGTYRIQRGRVEAIRHTIVPSIGFGYTPDFSKERYGFYQNIAYGGLPANASSNDLFRYAQQATVSRYKGFFLGDATSGANAGISFSINNTLEMKVRAKEDTSSKKEIGKKAKYTKVNILDGFSFSGSYNFLNKEYPLSTIGFQTATRILNNRLNITVNGFVDPYKYVLDSVSKTGKPVYYQRRLPNELAFQRQNPDNFRAFRATDAVTTRGIGQLQNLNIAISTNLNPDAAKKQVKAVPGKVTPDEAAAINTNTNLYVAWDIKWSLNVSYSASYIKTGFSPSEVRQNLNFNGNLSLTPKWKITFSSGYDFATKQIAATQIGIMRDLHCWDMIINWVPLPARYTSYDFTIRARASLLQDLKLTRQRNWYDR